MPGISPAFFCPMAKALNVPLASPWLNRATSATSRDSGSAGRKDGRCGFYGISRMKIGDLTH